MIIDATFEEKREVIESDFGILAKGEKGDKGEPFTYEDLTEEQKAELGNTEIVNLHEKRITNLEKKLSPEYFATDADTKHEKVVPSNACPFALINKVGGMTYRDEETQTLRDTKVTELVSEGANLIPYPFNTNAIENGVTFKDNGDGTVTLNGKSNGTNNNVFYLHKTQSPITIKAGTYSNGGDIHLTLFDNVNGKYYSFEMGKSLVLDKDVTGGLYIQISRADTTEYKKFVVHPTINRGANPAPYKPYRADAVDTFPISAQLRSYLEQHGYGRGVEGYEGYIDLDNKVFIPPQSHRVVLDGTENWILASTASSTGGLKRMQFTLPYTSVFESNYKTVPSICNLYNVGSGDDTWNGVVCASITNGERLHIFDANYQTIETWKAHLAELYANGNPLIIEYATASVPEPIDISAYLTDDNFIEVEGGGVIRAVNDYNRDAPTEITYMLKE